METEPATATQAPETTTIPTTIGDVSTSMKNIGLLQKHNLFMEVHAWNDYMPTFDLSGEPVTLPRPHLIVAFTSTTNGAIPSMSVSAKITGTKTTINVPLTADNDPDAGSYQTFRPRMADLQLLEMKGGETLTAEITITIGGEFQTLTFQPVVETTM